MIQQDFALYAQQLKDRFLSPDNTILSKTIWKSVLAHDFPEVMEIIDSQYHGMFKEVIYCILRDIPEIPRCPVCNNLLPLRSYISGFQKTCSTACKAKHFTESRRRGISRSRKQYAQYLHAQDSYFLHGHNVSYDPADKNYIIIHDYCSHSSVRIRYTLAKKIHACGHSSYCLQCNADLADTYSPAEEEILQFQSVFPDFYKEHSLAMKYQWWVTYYPKELAVLFTWYRRYFQKYFAEPLSLHTMTRQQYAEMYTVFLNRMTHRPLCSCKGCTSEVDFNRTGFRYRKFCDIHSEGYMQSAAENSLGDFLSSFGFPVLRRNRKLIGCEVDFLLPEQKIAVEFNGLWFHCTAFEKYRDDPWLHNKKYSMCKAAGYSMITVWEDDWRDRPDAVKDMFIRMLCPKMLETVCCSDLEMLQVSGQDAYSFLKQNSLKTQPKTEICYGLYHGDRLMMLACAGSSDITGYEDCIEVTDICCKTGFQITGGAERLICRFAAEAGNKMLIRMNNDCSAAGCNIKIDSTPVCSDRLLWWWFDRQNRFDPEDKPVSAEYKIFNSGTVYYKNNK